LRGPIKERVKALILMGEAQSRMQAAFQNLLPIHLVEGMEQGVSMAWNLAQKGDVILLSPACSSFDMFKDFQERGRIFKQAVLTLAGEKG
jgi:UDP-N-acetylmuramoylalanine--D-glutamate ligase